jgi:hypothetical protein
MHPMQKDQLHRDREQLARVVSFMQSERGMVSATVVLATGTAVVYRDGKVAFQPTSKGGPT